MMKEQLKQLIESKRAAIVAAVAALDQITQDQQKIREQVEALNQQAVKLQQAQQVALREKIEAQAALDVLERLDGND